MYTHIVAYLFIGLFVPPHWGSNPRLLHQLHPQRPNPFFLNAERENLSLPLSSLGGVQTRGPAASASSIAGVAGQRTHFLIMSGLTSCLSLQMLRRLVRGWGISFWICMGQIHCSRSPEFLNLTHERGLCDTGTLRFGNRALSTSGFPWWSSRSI